MDQLLMLSESELTALMDEINNISPAQISEREYMTYGGNRARKFRAYRRVGRAGYSQKAKSIISQIPKGWQRLHAPIKRDLLAWQRGEITLNARRIYRLKKSLSVDTEAQLMAEVTKLIQLTAA